MNKNNQELRSKKVHIELLRIFACYMVFYNHTDAAIRNVAANDLTKSRLVAMALFMLCKTAVPVFLMVAGANLMGKNDSPKKLLSRIGKIIVIILLASVFYHLYYYQTFDITIFVKELISGKTTLAIWYLYLYVGILLLLPILQRMRLSKQTYIYIFTLHLLGPGLLPFLEYYLNIDLLSNYLLLTEIPCYIIIFLLGDYLENELREEDLSLKNVMIAVAIVIISLGLSLFFAIYKMQMHNEAFDDSLYAQVYYTPIILLAGSIYFISKYIGKWIQEERLSKFIIKIGSYTLGIYIIGDFLRLQFEFVVDYLKTHLSELVSVLAYDVFLLVIGILIMWVYSAIKRIAKVMIQNEKDI